MKKHEPITHQVDPVVTRFLFISQILALIVLLSIGAWMYIVVTLFSFGFMGLLLLLKDVCIHTSFTFPFIKHRGA